MAEKARTTTILHERETPKDVIDKAQNVYRAVLYVVIGILAIIWSLGLTFRYLV